jgi:hypothetical protein
MYGHLPGGRLTVYGPACAESIEDPLADVLGERSLRLTIPIGPRRANRKAVLQVSDGQDRLLAFVKVGHNELTRALVRREGAALIDLAARTWSAVRVPRRLALVEWRDLTLLILEPLSMPQARLGGEEALKRLLSVVEEIATGAGSNQVPWEQHPLRKRLQQRLEVAGQKGSVWLSELSRLSGEGLIPTGTWHGDLNPGNIALSRGPCPVWDWERYEIDIPVGFDLLHHQLQDLITVRRVPPAAAVAKLLQEAHSMLARWGLSQRGAETVCRAYLIALAERYLADNQASTGSRLGAVDEWLLPGLRGSS